MISVVAATLAFGADRLFLAPGSVDILNFHLPGIASWIQEGSIWGVHEFVPDVSPGRYPNNGDVVLLAAILPWHSDFLSHLLPYAYYLLCGLAAYGLARRARRLAARGRDCRPLPLAMPIVALPTLANSFPDVIMVFGLAVGVPSCSATGARPRPPTWCSPALRSASHSAPSGTGSPPWPSCSRSGPRARGSRARRGAERRATAPR